MIPPLHSIISRLRLKQVSGFGQGGCFLLLVAVVCAELFLKRKLSFPVSRI
jgi:hypothetical protein